MGRPAKTLAQLVRDGSFRARRDSHRALLFGPELSWPGFALLQQQFRAAWARYFPQRQGFCLYALQSTMPLLPAKQRATHVNDWMSTDARIVCPDPLCGVVMRIERTGVRRLRHQDVSATPLDDEEPK